MIKRVFLIVLDSLGIGCLPDAPLFGDEGSNTLAAIRHNKNFSCPNLEKAGLFNIDGVGNGVAQPFSCYARMAEMSAGKDTTVGHWEIMGLISENPLPTYPNGFPDEIISEFSMLTGRGILCNKPYSGTEVIKDYGAIHMQTGDLIVYTSADSVFQIASHEDIVPLDELYRYCEIARRLLSGKHGVGRVIARPFSGEYPYHRTAGRHDYSLLPTGTTALDVLKSAGFDTVSVGKINDIFAGRGITKAFRTTSNSDGMDKTLMLSETPFNGLCFVNLVEFDSVYGHRNDVGGYAAAVSDFDIRFGELLSRMTDDDVIIITADHGCDPSTPSTDHSREYTPMLICGNAVKKGVNLGTRASFADIGATVLDIFGIHSNEIAGNSFWEEVKNA